MVVFVGTPVAPFAGFVKTPPAVRLLLVRAGRKIALERLGQLTLPDCRARSEQTPYMWSMREFLFGSQVEG